MDNTAFGAVGKNVSFRGAAQALVFVSLKTYAQITNQTAWRND
jgi:hypothetical protein